MACDTGEVHSPEYGTVLTVVMNQCLSKTINQLKQGCPKMPLWGLGAQHATSYTALCRKNVIEQKAFFDFLYNLCLKHYSF
jgi:hypothetical protein